MPRTVRGTWDLPASPPAPILQVEIEASADGGANFGDLVTVPAAEAQEFVAPDLEFGEWRFRFTIRDTFDQVGPPLEVVTDVVPALPGQIQNLDITLE